MRLARLLLVVAAVGALAPAAAWSGSRARPIVVVVHSGSSGRASGGSEFFSYGVVLRNRSATKDALDVRVRVFVLGQTGLVGVYVTTVPFLPAGRTFNVGNEPLAVRNAQRVVGVQVIVAVGGTRAAQGSLPAVSASPPVGDRIHGAVTNGYRRPIAVAGSRLYAVYYDRAGKIVGGDRLKGVSFGRRTIAPHGTARFVARLGRAVAAARIARVAVSMAPVLAKAGS